jgi:8-oxo-dGTP diphosphatase
MVVKSVLGIIFDEKKVLLVKRRDVPVWVLPGGGIEDEESAEDAIIREVKEETGLDVVIKRRVATYTDGYFIKPTHLFECVVVKGELSVNDEVKNVAYFDFEKLPFEIPPPFPEFIEDARKDIEPFERKITSITKIVIIKTLLKHPLLFFRFLLSRIGLHINTR